MNPCAKLPEDVNDVVPVLASAVAWRRRRQAQETTQLVPKPAAKLTAKDVVEALIEAKNHLGDPEYQTYAGWKAACKKAHPGCTFRGDQDIGGAVVDGKDVGEWGGDVGSVYRTKPKKVD